MKAADKIFGMLQEEIELMHKAKEVLQYSYNHCKTLDVKNVCKPAEAEKWEALSSRFARLSDILLQKVWRSLFLAELEEVGTPIDRVNKAEKKGLISSAEDFITIRLLRNQIAHDYTTEACLLYEELLRLTPILLEASDKVDIYLKKIAEKK